MYITRYIGNLRRCSIESNGARRSALLQHGWMHVPTHGPITRLENLYKNILHIARITAEFSN